MDIGRQKATITSNAIETIETKEGAKAAVVLGVEVGGESGRVTVWLTDKALGIARRHLKTCGFDPDKEDLSVLIDKPQRLAGREVEVVVEQKGNYMNISLPLGNAAPPRAEVSKWSKALRDVKKSHDDTPPEEPPAQPQPEPIPGFEEHRANDPKCVCKECIPF